MLLARAGRPGHTVTGQPRRNRGECAQPPRRVAQVRHRLRHLLRQLHARRGARGPPGDRAGPGGPRPVAALSGVDRQPGLRHCGGALGAEARQLSQHHAGRAVPRLGAQRGLRGVARADAAGPLGVAVALRGGGLGVQRVRAAGARLRGHGRRAAAHRHARQERRPRPRAHRPAGGAPGTRGRVRPAVRGEDLAAQGTARPGEDARRAAPHRRPARHACISWGRRSARPTSRRCGRS